MGSFGFRAAWWWVSGQVARPDSGFQLRVRGTSTSIREGECGMKTKNKRYVQIGDKAFKADGKYLVCNDIRTGEECFRKAFSHPRYETLKDLSISEVHASPDGKDIILLFALSSPGYKTVGNLARVATTGDVLWWAELTDTGRDTYVAVKTNGGRIVAQSWDGYSCEIDPKTGRILSKKFVK
jgi:hypothetical protein